MYPMAHDLEGAAAVVAAVAADEQLAPQCSRLIQQHLRPSDALLHGERGSFLAGRHFCAEVSAHALTRVSSAGCSNAASASSSRTSSASRRICNHGDTRAWWMRVCAAWDRFVLAGACA
jgi:hypothetical protein